MQGKSVPNCESGLIKLFVIFTGRMFVFVVKLCTIQQEGVIHPRLDNQHTFECQNLTPIQASNLQEKEISTGDVVGDTVIDCISIHSV